MSRPDEGGDGQALPPGAAAGIAPGSARDGAGPPRAVIFDFDGVIADTEGLHFETFARVLEEEGIRISGADHDERFLGVNDREGYRRAFAEKGREIPAREVDLLVARKSAYYRTRLGEVRLFPGAAELVEGLQGRCLLAIASGGRGVEIEAVLRAHELRECFLAILSADEVALSKPSPEPYLKALERLRVAAPGPASDLAAGECLVIEDSVFGIQAALAAGMRCLAVAHTFPREKLAAAHRVVERIGELSAGAILGEALTLRAEGDGSVR
jgi:HAD superfamily hydrolase (TIGR01509 family)